MTDLSKIQEQLQDTAEAIAKSEQVVASHPTSGAAKAMLRSFEKRCQVLEEKLFAAASQMGPDSPRRIECR